MSTTKAMGRSARTDKLRCYVCCKRDGLQYEFEILDAQGNQWDIKVDAKNGEVLSVKKEIL